MKKLLTLLVVSLLVLAGCGSNEPTLVEDQSAETLTIAVPADQDGAFIAGWTNSSYDVWVRNMIWGGYGVFYVDRDTGEYKENPLVLENLDVTEDDAGNKTYTFTIKEGLVWNDETPITAKDYVFPFLFRATPQHSGNAPQDSTGYELVGYGDYVTNGGNFEGVKLIDDKTFSLTINAEWLPFFFERALVAAAPEPMHDWFPAGEINADGNGFTNSAEEIAAAAQHVQDNVQFGPEVTNGAYNLVSFQDGVTTLTLNEHNAGNFEGAKAEIGTIVLRQVNSDQQIDALKRGEIDVVMGEIDGDAIDEVRNNENLKWHMYPRNGYGMLVLKTNKGATQYKEVRQAIAFLLNRDEFVQEISGGYAQIVNGPHGISQWFYVDRKDEIDDAITHYTLNEDEANNRLDASPYKFKEDGTTAWDGEGWRYDADGNQLRVLHFGSENNDVTELLRTQLPANAEKVGMEYIVDDGPFSALLNVLYGTAESDHTVLNLATGFTAVYDRYYAEHSDFADNPGYNNSQIADPELDKWIMTMRSLEGSQRDEFADAFVEYVTVWNDLLPQIPLYSNEYHDFTTARVTGFEDTVTTLSDFSQNIHYMRIVNP